ncbi:hypothetical protein BS47DRAFT_1400611 [Hydnum rufescens UP504]|uniref:Uncharacterized protein n=1 Tax=Hydnum rufescens UP504 TaxID=1448309 RepID=A0A9P6DIA5_9AGAM|nr:hypothetical protein BS47DRAFT_1400611 [Hydnum rufescens UP504]
MSSMKTQDFRYYPGLQFRRGPDRRSSTKEERQRENDARRHVKQAQRAKDYAEADRSRNELEAIEKSKAEELRWEAETHVREVEQREREASQSHQSAPTVSSAPPPHHHHHLHPRPSSPATSGSAQHAPLPLPLALPRYLLNPLHLLLDFLMSMLHALWPLFGIPPALDSFISSLCCPSPEPRPVPMSQNPQEHLGVCLFPREATGKPQGSKNGDVILLHHCGTIGANEIGTEPPNRPDQTYSVEDTTTSMTLLVPTTTLLVMDSAKMTALPISTEDNPCCQELMGCNHCKVKGVLLTLCLPHPTWGWSLV